MKKAGYILAVLLEILMLIGACVLNYFTKKKMGMARYVIYKNQGWERDFPMDTLKMAVIGVLVMLALIVLFFFWRKKKEVSKLTAAMNVGMLVLTLLYVGYTVFQSKETMRAYYFISLLLALAAFVQIVKTAAAVFLSGRGFYEK